MSTATATRQSTSHGVGSPTVLDATMRETERRQSLKGVAAEKLGVPADKVYDLLRNMWTVSKDQPELTDRELFEGLAMIAKYDLDPFAREIYVTRDKRGKLMKIVGIDGWVKIVHRSGDYDGHEWLSHFDEKGNMEWVDCVIHSRSRTHPTIYRAYAKEYAKLGGFMLANIPWHMLRLFAFRHAARFFTSLGSVYTEEEASWMSAKIANTSEPRSLDDLADQLNGRPAPREEDPPESDALDEAAALIADAKTIGRCDDIMTEYQGRDLPEVTKDRVTELCGARAEEIRASRGQRSNKQKAPEPEPQSPPAEELPPEMAASAELRDAMLRTLATATDQVTINIENEAIQKQGSGDLMPRDCEAVTSACRRRLVDLANASA